jgi:hypothetical protein
VKEVLAQDEGKERYESMKRAAEQWGKSFDSIPHSLVLKLYQLGDRLLR